MSNVESSSFYLLTICIPTYNRSLLLKRLVENIQATCSFFDEIEIIVIDDGSTDDTAEYIKSIIESLSIKLIYFYKKNGGKISAVLYGLNRAKGKYFMNMDDDDLFPKTGLDLILKEIKILEIETNSNHPIKPVIGIAGLALASCGENIGMRFPKSPLLTNFAKLRADYRVSGDKKEIVKSDVFRKVNIELFPNEKRTPFSVIWLCLSTMGDIKFLNSPFIIKNYLPEGLSKNLLPIRISCPNSSMTPYKIMLELTNYSNFLFRFRASINFWRFRFHGAKKQHIQFPNFLCSLFHYSLFPLGFFLTIRDRVLLIFQKKT